MTNRRNFITLLLGGLVAPCVSRLAPAIAQPMRIVSFSMVADPFPWSGFDVARVVHSCTVVFHDGAVLELIDRPLIVPPGWGIRAIIESRVSGSITYVLPYGVPSRFADVAPIDDAWQSRFFTALSETHYYSRYKDSARAFTLLTAPQISET